MIEPKALLACLSLAALTGCEDALTRAAPMVRTDTAATDSGWTVIPVFTVGESIGGYVPPGILDGIAAFAKDRSTVRLLVNHELNPGNGYTYVLANGTQLNGARVSYFDIDKKSLRIKDAGLAYDTIYDRAGVAVIDPRQINATDNGIDGFARLCSAMGVRKGDYGFVDDIGFVGEEISTPYHPHGGTAWAIDLAREDVWAVPALGRAAFENVTPLDTGSEELVALLTGDDAPGAPLYLYVGVKDEVGDGSFLDRNGLKHGTLYAWKADGGDRDPSMFNGVGARRTGIFAPLRIRATTLARRPGFDALGYLDDFALRGQARRLGAFSFSRPEDLHTNPSDGGQAVFVSTGSAGLYPADAWGTVYKVDVEFGKRRPVSKLGPPLVKATLSIVYDGDDTPVPDAGIRNPDNVTWAHNGDVYIQEDLAVRRPNLFGAATGIEASIWQLDMTSGEATRIAELERASIAPSDAHDFMANTIGAWESSGVLDVTELFGREGTTLLVGTVQAHSIQDGSVGHNLVLDEGGQLFFLER